MSEAAAVREALPLFPLQTVLFPGAQLALKVFETRYLDLVGRCLREGRGFGVPTLKRGGEVRRKDGPTPRAVELETHGVLAEVIEVDAVQPNLLHLRCRGTRRFAVHAASEQPDGLWVGEVSWLADDAVVAPAPEHAGCVKSLEEAIAVLGEQGVVPFLEPYRFDDAGWVANRWCELLPMPQAAKLQLMRLEDPLARLGLVDAYLREQRALGEA